MPNYIQQPTRHVHAPYPAMRYHKDGVLRTIVPNKEAEADLYQREPNVWFDHQQPKPYVAPPPPEPTLHDLDNRLESMEDELRLLKSANEFLVKSITELNESISELAAVIDGLPKSKKGGS